MYITVAASGLRARACPRARYAPIPHRPRSTVHDYLVGLWNWANSRARWLASIMPYLKCREKESPTACSHIRTLFRIQQEASISYASTACHAADVNMLATCFPFCREIVRRQLPIRARSFTAPWPASCLSRKRSDRVKGFVVQPRRWVVERTIASAQPLRRLAKDWENLNRNALAFIKLVKRGRVHSTHAPKTL